MSATLAELQAQLDKLANENKALTTVVVELFAHLRKIEHGMQPQHAIVSDTYRLSSDATAAFDALCEISSIAAVMDVRMRLRAGDLKYKITGMQASPPQPPGKLFSHIDMRKLK